jgi:hypothetical protein
LTSRIIYRRIEPLEENDFKNLHHRGVAEEKIFQRIAGGGGEGEVTAIDTSKVALSSCRKIAISSERRLALIAKLSGSFGKEMQGKE